MKLALSLSDPAQKRKALLIPVLVVGLAWSLAPGEEAPEVKPPARPAKADRPVSDRRPSAPRKKTWTELSLAEITAFNPFPIPAEVPPPEPIEPLNGQAPKEAPAEAAVEAVPPLQKWESQSVSIVYRGPKGPLAVIGDRTIGIGDFLDETTIVVDIREDGVWVSQFGGSSPGIPSRPSLPNPPEPSPGL